MLETRQASSDEELLSTDEMEGISDYMNEELAVNFDLPGKVHEEHKSLLIFVLISLNVSETK